MRISKAADMQLARNLAQELSPHNIRVNCIAPGLVKTDFARALWDTPEAEASARARGRLCGDWANQTISPARPCSWPRAPGPGPPGQTLVIDGGDTA